MVTGVTPVVPTSDVAASVQFYKEVLGFDKCWLYGEPPTFGGASFAGASIMFNLEPELAGAVEGHQLWLDVDDVDDLYHLYIERGAVILSPVEDKPWNRREFTVRDPSGYHLRFAGFPGYASKLLPEASNIHVVRQMPSRQDFERVTMAAFGNRSESEGTLSAAWAAFVALDEGQQVVGVLRVMFDAPGWYSVWDVAVLPECQGRKVGSRLMEAAIAAVRAESPGAFVYLFTFKHPFYERLGFSKTSVMSINV